MAATRSALQGLCVAIAVQVVLGLGGNEQHSAWMIAPLAGLWVFENLIGRNYQSLFLIAAGMIFLSALGHALFVRVPYRETELEPGALS